MERIAARLRDTAGLSWFRAPGRVNLIGDHTDYNAGFVLPVAIDRDCVVAVRPSETVRVTSLDMNEVVEVSADGRDGLDGVVPAWGRLVEATVEALAGLGRPPKGMDAVVASDVPLGSGLSSSAAFEVACAISLASVAGWDVAPAAIAAACRSAEEAASGVPCGIMDQLTAVCGRAGFALLIDCRSLELTSVTLPPDAGLLVVHSGEPRTLAASGYADRRRACEELAASLGLTALRDATRADVENNPIGRHVVSENERVLEAAEALESGDLLRLGALMSGSHASLRDDFRVSTPALDALVEALIDAGAYGARLTGAGFGGAVVAVCDGANVSDLASAAVRQYRERTGLEPAALPVRSVDGAGRFDPDGR